MELPEGLKQFAEVLVDAYFVVDRERNIVAFNQAFRAMFPRSVARNLICKKCYEVLELSICKNRCIAEQCWSTQKQVRLDEIRGGVKGSQEERHAILSAIPLRDAEGNIVGALEVQRDVTDDVIVRKKYQQQSEQGSETVEELTRLLHERSRQLFERSRELDKLRLELFRAKTDLYG
jgi:PAS domain-containing protein